MKKIDLIAEVIEIVVMIVLVYWALGTFTQPMTQGVPARAWWLINP